jgi:hypothetical protein
MLWPDEVGCSCCRINVLKNKKMKAGHEPGIRKIVIATKLNTDKNTFFDK